MCSSKWWAMLNGAEYTRAAIECNSDELSTAGMAVLQSLVVVLEI